jgi:hypothetical protein
MYFIVLSARIIHRLVEYYRVHSPTSQLSIVIHVISGNPSYGILDRVPYIDVLHCLGQRVGDSKTRDRYEHGVQSSRLGSCLSCMIDVVTRLSILVMNLKQVSLCIKKEGGVNA